MIPMPMLLIAIVLSGGMAIVGWVNVSGYAPFAIQYMSAFDCTFACDSHTVSVFTSAIVLSAFMTVAAILFSLLALVQRQ